MSNVVNIAGAPAASAAQPNAEVITELERLLSDAMSGRIQHLVVVTSNGREMPIDRYVGTGEPEQVAALIGGMELCKHTMLMAQFQESTEYPPPSAV